MTQDIAIIVPSHARPGPLSTCLTALDRLEGGPYRTYVVDDGSPEPLAPVCAPYANVTCLRQDNAGPAAARNAGVAAARAEGATFLCFTDDDCEAHPGWVRSLMAAQDGDPSRLVGGRIDNALPENVFSSASQSICDYLYAHYNSGSDRSRFFTSNNLACSADSFTALGGFDTSFPFASEDRDFSLRWQGEIGPLVYAPDAVVDHAHHLTLRRFWRQHASYGRGARRLHLALEARGDDRPKTEPASFYTGLLLHPLRRPGRARLGQSFLTGLSQVAMVVGYMQERRSET